MDLTPDTAASDVTPGSPVLYPATDGAGVLHLARTEARKRGHAAFLGVCPATSSTPLVRASKLSWWRWWRRRRWCPDCKAYGAYLSSKPTV